MATHSVLLPGKSHGWRSMVGYSPCDRKELDVTERLHFFTSNVIVIRVIYILSCFRGNFKITIFVVVVGQAKWLAGS